MPKTVPKTPKKRQQKPAISHGEDKRDVSKTSARKKATASQPKKIKAPRLPKKKKTATAAANNLKQPKPKAPRKKKSSTASSSRRSKGSKKKSAGSAATGSWSGSATKHGCLSPSASSFVAGSSLADYVNLNHSDSPTDLPRVNVSRGRNAANKLRPPEPDVITPELRFRVQRLLRAALGVEDIDAARPDGVFATLVEEALFDSASPADYRRKSRQLCYALARNGFHLRCTYSPDQVVALDDGLLSRTSKADLKQKARDHQAAYCRYLMQVLQVGVFSRIQQLNTDMQCSNNECRSKDLSCFSLQTCSGDEGQTVYWSCRKCGMKGRLCQ